MSEITISTGHPDAGRIYAEALDRVTAERDAALGREAALIESAKVDALGIRFEQKRVETLQQRLTAADERADVLEGLLRDSKDVMSGIWDQSYNHDAGDALAALYLMERIDAALKPAEAEHDFRMIGTEKMPPMEYDEP